MDYSAITLDSFPVSSCSTSRDDILESAGGWGYFDSKDSSALSIDHSEQIYQQCAVRMESTRDAFDLAGMSSRTRMEERYANDDGVNAAVGLLQDQQGDRSEEHFFSRCDYSASSSKNPQAAAAAATAHFSSSVGTDEDAVMRAMMAIIFSANSSSSAASSPSGISNTPPAQEAVTPPAAPSSPPPSRAFGPYSSRLEPRETSTACGGQKMIRESIEMLRRMRSQKGEESSSRSTNNNNSSSSGSSNQLHHMISERRRREKLNDSFQRLRMTLPPCSKKDKTSVLMNARNHLRTLRTQIAELEEKNRRLETHLLREEGGEEGSGVRVQVMKGEVAAAAAACAQVVLQQIHIMITVRVKCDAVDLLLCVLECLRGLRVVSIGAVEAFTNSTQMPAFARANLKLQIRSCDWDEVLLKEAVNRAIDAWRGSNTP